MNKTRVTRVAVISLAVMLVGLLLAGACSQPAPATAPTPASKPAQEKLPEFVVFAGAGSGKMYDLGAFVSEMLTKYTPMKSSIEGLTGGTAATEMVAKGDYQYAALSPPMLKMLSTEKKFSIWTLFSSAGVESSTISGVFTKPNSGIKTIKDLRGKKFYGNYPGTVWFDPASRALLKANGMTTKDVTYLTYGKADDAFRDLKEGRVDALHYLAGSGSQEMAQSTGIFIIPLSPAEQKEIVDLGLGFEPIVWPAKSFGAPVDTPTVGAAIEFFSSPKTSNIVAYTIVKAVFEHLKEFQASQKAAEGYTLQNALATWAFPYHPGAIQYFKEIGIWTAEHDKKQQQALDAEKKMLGG